MTDGHEDAVERVLRGLRDVEGAPGLEARVLARVAGEEALASASDTEGLGAGRGWIERSWDGARNSASFGWEVLARMVRDGARKEEASKGFGWSGVVAGLGLIAVLVGGDLWVRGRAHTGFARRRGVTMAARGNDAFAAAGRRGAAVPLAGAGIAAPESRGAVFIGEPKRRLPRRRGELVAAEASSGRSVEPVVVSFPAPAMALTRQERLLLRMLRGGETGQLMATLSLRAEEAMQRREGMRRQEFFAPDRPEVEAERKATGMSDAGAPVDGVGHVGPALKVPMDQGVNALETYRRRNDDGR